MGYGSKFVERERARELRAQSWTLREIDDELDVATGSVSVWVRDVDFVPKPRNRGHTDQEPHPLHVRKLEEIERCRVEAESFIGALSGRDLELFCLALYAGEGTKTDGAVKLANTNASSMRIFIAWLRGAFEIDELRLRMTLYLHAISTSMPRWSSGALRWTSHGCSSPSHIEQWPTRRAAPIGTSTAAQLWCTTAH